MKVFPREDKEAICVIEMELNPDGSLSLKEANALYNGLCNAIRECGFEIKLTVEVPRHIPTEEQLNTAVHRVAHLRKSFDSTPWNDLRANRELVRRVLEACL